MIAFYITIRTLEDVNTRKGKKQKTRVRKFVLITPKHERAAVRRTWEGSNTTIEECEVPKHGAVLALNGESMTPIGAIAEGI